MRVLSLQQSIILQIVWIKFFIQQYNGENQRPNCIIHSQIVSKIVYQIDNPQRVPMYIGQMESLIY